MPITEDIRDFMNEEVWAGYDPRAAGPVALPATPANRKEQAHRLPALAVKRTGTKDGKGGVSSSLLFDCERPV
jgi:hypothetical protein